MTYSSGIVPKKLRRLKNYKERLTVGQYLIKRLESYQIQYLFGKADSIHPSLLQIMQQMHTVDYVPCHHSLQAAQGYAKINKIAAFVASVACIIKNAPKLFQAACENCPLVTIFCTKMPFFKNENAFLAEFEGYKKEQKEALHLIIKNGFTVYSVLDDAEVAAKKIDQTLDLAFQFKKPVCIELSEKMCDAFIPPHTAKKTPFSASDPEILRDCLSHIKDVLKCANKPFLCLGACVASLDAEDLAVQFAENFALPIGTEMYARGTIDEDHPLFFGQISDTLPQALSTSDTGIFCTNVKSDKLLPLTHTICIQDEYTSVDNVRYPHIYLHDVIEQLALADFGPKKEMAFPKAKHYAFVAKKGSQIVLDRLVSCVVKYSQQVHLVTQDQNILSKMKDAAFTKGSVITSEQDCDFALPASIGASFAIKSRPHLKRTVALLAENSFQASIQDLTCALHYNLKPLIIIYNTQNDGLDINYKALQTFYGQGKILQIETEDALDTALQEAITNSDDAFILLDVRLSPDP